MPATRAMVVAKKRSPAMMLPILMMSSRFAGDTVCANSANFVSVGTRIACWLDGLDIEGGMSVGRCCANPKSKSGVGPPKSKSDTDQLSGGL